MLAPPALNLNGGSQIGFASVESGRYYITLPAQGQRDERSVIFANGENVQFNACAEKRPRLGSESNAKAAPPTSVEILIRMLLIGGIKCFMMKRIRAAYHARNA